MPCYDSGPSVTERILSKQQRVPNADMLKAMLCAVMTLIEQERGESLMRREIFDCIDYVEAGITKKEFMAWWKKHKSEDVARKHAAARQAEVFWRAQNKLDNLFTLEELAALGLKK